MVEIFLESLDRFPELGTRFQFGSSLRDKVGIAATRSYPMAVFAEMENHLVHGAFLKIFGRISTMP